MPFSSKLAPGGGTWGGGMLMNEVVVQDDAAEILNDFDIASVSLGNGYRTLDSVEMASGLIFGARKAGAVIFNTVCVEDIVVHAGVISGVVINWNPVRRLEMHVDPIVVSARAVVDGTGHPSEIVQKAVNKAGVKIDSPTGGILGEKPMWMEDGERTTVENTKRLFRDFTHREWRQTTCRAVSAWDRFSAECSKADASSRKSSPKISENPDSERLAPRGDFFHGKRFRALSCHLESGDKL